MIFSLESASYEAGSFFAGSDLAVAAATENDNDSKDDNPGAVIVKDVA